MIYLASPYSHPDPFIREARYLSTMKVLASKLIAGEIVYSPIVHCHEIAKIFGLPKEADFWRTYNFGMLALAKRLEVLRLDGWEQSVGIKDEIEEAARLRLELKYI